MRETYIFDAVRSPRGKGHAEKGSLRNIKPIDLLSQLYTAIESRNDLDSSQLDLLILGCVGQVKDQGSNIAKISAIYHGWDDNIEGISINTFCTSAMTAIGLGMAKINSGMADLAIVGGIEMLSQVPMFADRGMWFADPVVSEKTGFTMMGVSADLIASQEKFSSQELDEYAVLSHHRAAGATANGTFKRSIISIQDEQGEIILKHDECIRGGLTVEKLNAMPSIFEAHLTSSVKKKVNALYPNLDQIKHLHSIGTSPSMADGASILLVGSKEKGEELGLTPIAKIKSFDSTSCEPIIMLLGGQLSAKNAIRKAGLTMNDIGRHNFAEAFSATCLKYQRDFNISSEIFNVNGCTMSMGHAQGASGAMITTTLLDEMHKSGINHGVASISGGAGLGGAVVLEQV